MKWRFVTIFGPFILALLLWSSSDVQAAVLFDNTANTGTPYDVTADSAHGYGYYVIAPNWDGSGSAYSPPGGGGVTGPHYSTTPTLLRVKRLAGVSCSTPHNINLNNLDGNPRYTVDTGYATGVFCDYPLTSAPAPDNDEVIDSIAFCVSDGCNGDDGAIVLDGSPTNTGHSADGRWLDRIVAGGVAFQVCDSGGCSGGFDTPIINSNITASTTWSDHDTYVISGNVQILPGVVLTIGEGAIVKFDTATSSSLTVNGTLIVDGGENDDVLNEVIFTSLKDDTFGGDTNNDASSTAPNSGDWGGIIVGSGATTTINHALIRYGGNDGAMVENAGGLLSIATSSILQSSDKGIQNSSGTTTATAIDLGFNTYGLYVFSGYSNISGSSTIHDNSSYGVYNTGSATVDAESNWWGTNSGPYNASSNPSGTGDNVSIGVDFTPWITTVHYLIDPDCHSGDLCGSVRNNNLLIDSGSTVYKTQLDAATSTWQSLAKVSILEATSTSNLQVVDVTNRPDFAWKGQWAPQSSQPDLLQLNDYYLNQESNSYVQNTITHELGHALGLSHSYTGNIMSAYQSSQTTLGSQDENDYNYLWP